MAATQQEFDALTKNNTWTLASLFATRIGCKWVFLIEEMLMAF